MALVRVLPAIALALICLLVVPKPSMQHEEHIELAYRPIKVEDVCSNRLVPVISVSEAQRMINEVVLNPDLCHETYVQSFTELEPILKETPKDLICSEKKFELIKAYHFRYINPRVEVYKLGDDLNHLNTVIKSQPLHEEKVSYAAHLDDYKQKLNIPISLHQFFKAWVLQVCGICKKNLVVNIERAMQNYDESDLDLIDLHTKTQENQSGELVKKSKKNYVQSRILILPLTGQKVRADNLQFPALVYMPELEGEAEPGDLESRKEVKFLDLHSEPDLNKFMHACQYRFKPVYDQLIMPIVRLGKLGYDYQGKEIDSIRTKLDSDPLINKWKLVTALCESIGNYELVDNEGINMEQYDYMPMLSSTLGDNMWIKGSEALRKELNLIKGHQSEGIKRLMFEMGVQGRKILAAIDPHQSAFYRKNQNTISSVLNTFSIASNAASIGLTIAGG